MNSIRARFLLVIFLGAVVPLVLIGVWLTQSVVHAGEDLLHNELEQSVQKLADAAALRWNYQSGELALLANNEVAVRLLATDSSPSLASTDSAYLDQLFTTVSSTIRKFEYRDSNGAVRWTSVNHHPDSSEVARQRTGVATPAMTILREVTAVNGQHLGMMTAQVSVAALIPSDTALRLPNGARLEIVPRNKTLAMLPSFVAESLLERARFKNAGADWLAVHRSLTDPEVDLVVTAPLSAYVQPFENVARKGMLTLAVVALLVLIVAGFLTARLTGSLERLATAADAVAAGELQHRVAQDSKDEVGRVGIAFNSMLENLRRTLGELSKRQALAAVGEYAAALAHEVRNGLTAVRVDLQRAEEKIPKDVTGSALIGRALDNVKRLDRTVTTSLRVARRGRATPRRFDLRPLLCTTARNAEGAFNERGALLNPISKDGASAWVLGDAMALEQLFLNLLLNAAQALERGGEAIMTLNIESAELQVVVADNGVGILPDDLDQVLDPFFSTKTDGTGLGLSIARQIAASHGGSLRIESAPGDGARVEVRLPLAAAPSVIMGSEALESMKRLTGFHNGSA